MTTVPGFSACCVIIFIASLIYNFKMVLKFKSAQQLNELKTYIDTTLNQHKLDLQTLIQTEIKHHLYDLLSVPSNTKDSKTPLIRKYYP